MATTRIIEYKNKSRNDLAQLFKGVGVEIGVERAVFSKTICRKNPETKLYAVDPWKAYKGYRDHVSQEKLDAFYEEAKERMKDFNCVIIRKFSSQAVQNFEDESLDFVYIDANHDYDHVMEDMQLWYKKVKRGGMLCGHDYIRRKGQDHLYGVKQAVTDFTYRYNIPQLFIYRGDNSPSWMFYKYE